MGFWLFCFGNNYRILVQHQNSSRAALIQARAVFVVAAVCFPLSTDDEDGTGEFPWLVAAAPAAFVGAFPRYLVKHTGTLCPPFPQWLHTSCWWGQSFLVCLSGPHPYHLPCIFFMYTALDSFWLFVEYFDMWHPPPCTMNRDLDENHPNQGWFWTFSLL